MSTPFGSEIAALMLRGNSAQNPAQVKATMMSRAEDEVRGLKGEFGLSETLSRFLGAFEWSTDTSR